MADGDVTTLAEVNLGTFLNRLQATVERVQHVANEQHARQLDRFLDDDGTPLVRRVKVPDPTAAGWREFDVPLLALAPLTSMQMKELTIEFDSSMVSVLNQPDGSAARSLRATSVRMGPPPSSGRGLATVRVVFEPGAATTPHRSAVAIDFDDDGSDPDDAARPVAPIHPPRRRQMATDPSEDFAFTIEGAQLIGEERIDPHEEEATVAIVVTLAILNHDSNWELTEARLSVDVGGLPDSVAFDGGEPAENLQHFQLDVEELLANEAVEVHASVKTGTFAVQGGPAAEGGSYPMAAHVEAMYVPIGGAIVEVSEGQVTIDVARD